MNPNDRVAGLVTRTLSNLQTIDDLALERTASYESFEVTQMVNSLLSLLVVPRELGTVDFVGDSQVHPDGIRKWHRSPVKFELTELGGRRPQHLKKFLGGLRNSVAHANFKFIADAEGAISALTFTSCARDGTPRWSVKFLVTELRNFLVNLGDELLAAREYQIAHAKDFRKIAEPRMTDVEIQLPTSSVQRIGRLVATNEAESVTRFIQEAVEDKLRDDEDVAAA